MKLSRVVVSLLRPTAPTLLAALSLDPPFSGIAAAVVGDILSSASLSTVSGQPSGKDGPRRDLLPEQVVEIIEQNASNPEFILTLREAEATLKAYELRAGMRFAELDVAGLGMLALDRARPPRSAFFPRFLPHPFQIIIVLFAIGLACVALIVLGALLEVNTGLTSALSASVVVPFLARAVPWLAAGLVGAAVGALEIALRQRESKLAPFRLAPMPCLLYIVVNGAAALAALSLLNSYKSTWADVGLVTLQSYDVAIAVIVSMIFMRGTIFTLRVRSEEVTVGPAMVLAFLMRVLDLTIDRRSAEARAQRLRLMMRGVSFQTAREILLPGVLTLTSGIAASERQELERQVDKLDSTDTTDEVKVLQLGLILWHVVGEAPLRMAVTTFGPRLRGDQETAEAVLSLNRRIEGLLVQPTLVRYVGKVVVEVLRADAQPVSLIDGAPGFAPGETGRLVIQFRPEVANRDDGSPVPPTSSPEVRTSHPSGEPAVPPTTVDTAPQELREEADSSTPPGQPAVFQADIRISRGEQKPELVFDVSIDAGETVFDRTRASCPVRTDMISPPVAFVFTAPVGPGRHEFFIEVSQFNRLVEVVTATIDIVSETART